MLSDNNGERLGVLVSGRGSNLQAIIDASVKGEIKSKIACVISDKENSYGLERAKDYNPKFVDPKKYESRKDYDREIFRILKENHVSLVILAGYMRIVTSELIEHYKNRMMNIHPSLLPSFPGINAQKQALDYGVKISGCTVHFVEEGMDEGPIIIQTAVIIPERATPDELAEIILKEEHQIYLAAIKLFEEKRLNVEGRIVRIK